jgi:hypothetical protein
MHVMLDINFRSVVVAVVVLNEILLFAAISKL